MSKVDWKIEGTIKLESQFKEVTARYGSNSEFNAVPLKNLTVKISAKESPLDPSFEKWGEVKTDDAGFFSLCILKDKSPRRFKIEVFFKNDDFVIYPDNKGILLTLAAGAALAVGGLAGLALEQTLVQTTKLAYDVDWFTIFQADSKEEERGPGNINFPKLRFRKGADYDLGDSVARKHADIWFLYYKVKEYFASFSDNVGFLNERIAVKYPHNNSFVGEDNEAPYASPYNNIIFIAVTKDFDGKKNDHKDDQAARDWCDVDTLLHELMHIWAYQHCTGEMSIAWQLIKHGSTHEGLQAESFTAFHEGFAEWCSNRVYSALFVSEKEPSKIYGELSDTGEPFNRKTLLDKGVLTVLEAERSEYAWISLFNMLCQWDLFRYTLNSNVAGDIHSNNDYVPKNTEHCSSPKAFFEDVLKVFKAAPDKGFPKILDKKEMNMDSFLKRFCAIVPGFSAADVGKYKILIATEPNLPQPHDLFCTANIKSKENNKPAPIPVRKENNKPSQLPIPKEGNKEVKKVKR